MRALLPVLVLLMLCNSAAFADKILLKNGKILRTTIIEEDGQSILVEDGEFWKRINKSEIELIKKDGEGSTPSVQAKEETRPSKPVIEDSIYLTSIGVLLDGAVVSRVTPGTPASRAGVSEGDRIIAVDGEKIVSSSILVQRLRGEAGTKVTIGVLRIGVNEPIKMTMRREGDAVGIEDHESAVPAVSVSPDPGTKASSTSSPQLPQSEGVLKVSYDFAGKHAFTGNLQVGGLYGTSNTNKDVTNGITLTGEYISYVDQNVGLGFGASYQIPRKQTDVKGDFNFVPLYGLLKIRTTPDRYSNSCYYAVGHLGYNLFYGDTNYTGVNGKLENGVYYGVGAGMKAGGFQFELLYTVNNGSYKDSGIVYISPYYYTYYGSGDVKYSKIALSVGLSF